MRPIAQLKEKLKEVSFYDDWAHNMLRKVDEWEKEQSLSSKTLIQSLEAKINQTEQKLDKLVNAFLEGLIDRETYLRKKDELIKTKSDLYQKKSDFDKGRKNWFEPLRDWINTAHYAEKLALSDNLHEIKAFLEKIGTNRRLLDRKFF